MLNAKKTESFLVLHRSGREVLYTSFFQITVTLAFQNGVFLKLMSACFVRQCFLFSAPLN